MADHLRAAEEGLAHDDPWDGLAHFVTEAVLAGTGALGPIAGTIEVTDDDGRPEHPRRRRAGQV